MHSSPLAPRPEQARQIKLDRPCQPGSLHQGIAKEIVPTLRQFGIDPDPLVRGTALDPRRFDNEADALSHAALGRLLALCATRTACPNFGLLVGQCATIETLGLVGRLMRYSETVGDALRALVSHLGLQNCGSVTLLDVEGDTAVFSYLVHEPGVVSANQIADAVVACTVNTIRALCGSCWNPVEVLLPRTTPANREPYRRHFRAPVRFDQEVAAIVLSARDLDIRIAGADPLLRTILEEQLASLESDLSSGLADDIRRMLRTRLTSNRCSADRVAGSLTMHRRTLSRRLSGEGAGFRALTNEIRFETACQLLDDTQIPLGQIAAALGYSEASAFSRAFRRWSGRTPTAWRAKCHPGSRTLAA